MEGRVGGQNVSKQTVVLSQFVCCVHSRRNGMERLAMGQLGSLAKVSQGARSAKKTETADTKGRLAKQRK